MEEKDQRTQDYLDIEEYEAKAYLREAEATVLRAEATVLRLEVLQNRFRADLIRKRMGEDEAHGNINDLSNEEDNDDE